MTTSDLLGQRPAIRKDLVLGPVVRRGAARVALAMDRSTGRKYEFPEKLQFIIARLDGTRLLSEIGESYAAAFGRKLDEKAWQQILGQLRRRKLFAGMPADEPEPATRRRSTLLMGRVGLGDPTAVVDRWHRYARVFFHPPVAAVMMSLFVAMEVTVVAKLPELFTGTEVLLHHPLSAIVALILLFVSMGLHEFAHGITARHFGGGVREIGVAWVLPAAFPYCRVEGVFCFSSRWHRAATAFAGIFANLLFLLPFFVLLLTTPTNGRPHEIAAGLLLIGSFRAVANLLPLPNWDGYRVLSYLLGMVDLSAESRRYCHLAMRRAAKGYPKWTSVVYIGYPVVATISGIALFMGAVFICYRLGTPLIGAPGVITVLAVLTCGGLAIGGITGRRLRRGKPG